MLFVAHIYVMVAGALVNILSDTDVQPNQSIYLSKLEKTIERLSDLVGDAQLYYEIELQSASIEGWYKLP